MTQAPLLILSLVFALIAVRQAFGMRLRIWQIMAAGAVADLLAGSITPIDAIRAVNVDVMVFLFGMFVAGEALVESGYLYHLSFGLFSKVKTTDGLILAILFVMGFLSAFLMNDTVAVIGTPLVLLFASRHNMPGKLLLLTLAFAVTIGSVASPIGNPQNLLVAISGGVEDPFVTFFRYLAVPTVISLFIAYLLLKFLYGVHFHRDPLNNVRDAIKDAHLAMLAKISLGLIFILVAVKILAVFFGYDFRLTWIAVAACLPILFFSPRRLQVIRQIDWPTLVFFASMFIVMEALWRSGVIQSFLAASELDLASTDVILASGILLSQILSNVPFVALYLPVLTHLGASTEGLMALAAGSTIAGNLLILGAASNVIIIQGAERRGETLTFLEFARAGVPLTVANALVYWAWFRVIG